MVDWTIERLTGKHDRKNFSCGKPSLDNFLRKLVSQYDKRNLGRTFVATEPETTRVAGYYTLAAGSIDMSCLTEKERHKLPTHPLPTIHLGRLAVDQSYHGKRLGETLLFHALHSALELSDELGVFAVDLLAIDDDAVRFYQKYGFLRLQDHSHHIYLPLKTIEKMFAT